ncbi:ion transporter [Sphingomonas sp.]|uniref:ion transporter n=1 Tax=Sphingomonas sp. TaxID=28214 RepID=UPI002D809A20|nr:ion transporter [Sphingomonas sp.]HEU0045293.1 ion transporter [Sphingomonas sp.]
MLRAARRKLYVQLAPERWPGEGLSPLNAVICVAVLLATAVAIVETEPFVARGREQLFRTAEIGFGLFFAAEYLGRLWVVSEADDPRARWRRRVGFVLSPSGLIDLVVILTSFAPFLTQNAQMLRLLRLIRIVRLAKLGRLSVAMRYLGEAIGARRMELGLTAGMGLGLMVAGATLLYWLEGHVQPDKFGSIPRALWWAVITLTTTGYGDVFPITPAGKLVGGLMAICGIGVIALPAGIFASAFSDAVQRGRADKGEPNA